MNWRDEVAASTTRLALRVHGFVHADRGHRIITADRDCNRNPLVDESANLKLPFLMPAQAQKHVTHNEALRMLDALVQLAVLDRHLTSPPATPLEGDRYIIASPATGAWAGQEHRIAAWQDGAWAFFVAKAGWLAWVADETLLYFWSGSAWQSVLGAVTALQNLALLGVGTTADATNPFAAKLNKALWTAKTVAEGGDGDLRYTLNKETAADVVSLLFQSGFSGRAEAGLVGDNDFTIKVSADGSSWHNGLVIDRTTGRPSFPSGGAATTPATTTAGHVPTYANTSGNQLDTGFPVTATAKTLLDDASTSEMRSTLGVRDVLAANRTYYVRTDGSDSNNGLANTSGGAFLTIQKAVDVAGALDLSVFTATIQVADGTYGGAIVLRSLTGGGVLIIQGNTTTPANVVLSRAGTILSGVNYTGSYTLTGFKMTTTSGDCITVLGPVQFAYNNIEFGSCAGAHVRAAKYALVRYGPNNYKVSGSAGFHWYLDGYARIEYGGSMTITVTGTLTFSQWIRCDYLCHALILSSVVTFDVSGATVTGQRYLVGTGSVIQTGGGANYFPGSTAGGGAGTYV